MYLPRQASSMETGLEPPLHLSGRRSLPSRPFCRQFYPQRLVFGPRSSVLDPRSRGRTPWTPPSVPPRRSRSSSAGFRPRPNESRSSPSRSVYDRHCPLCSWMTTTATPATTGGCQTSRAVPDERAPRRLRRRTTPVPPRQGRPFEALRLQCFEYRGPAFGRHRPRCSPRPRPRPHRALRRRQAATPKAATYGW